MKRAERQTEELMRDAPIDDFRRSLGEAWQEGQQTSNLSNEWICTASVAFCLVYTCAKCHTSTYSLALKTGIILKLLL